MAKVGRRPVDIRTRLAAKTLKTDTCWLWQGCVFWSGYGKIWRDGKSELAHRVAYELANGEGPGGSCVCHTCDVRTCVNPSHLFLGSLSDNINDMHAKGRNARGSMLPHTKLSEDDVLSIRSRASKGETIVEIAHDYPVSPSHMSRIVSNRRWTYLRTEA